MQAIERIRTAMYHESDDLEFACNPAAMTEVLAHIDKLEAENERLTECLKKANSQSEHFEREWYLRGDEVERLRKDAERYQYLRKASIEMRNRAEHYCESALDVFIDAAMKGTP